LKETLLQYLSCPNCDGQLQLQDVAETEGIEILRATLLCSDCSASFPVLRGVPRFADLQDIDEDKAATASSFGWQWQHFTQDEDFYERQLLGWLAPVQPSFLKDKVVLEGGCGKGRHTLLAERWGARDVVSVDLSDAVETAFAATKGSPNMHIVQADLCKLPLRPIFDYAFTVGVLHHTPDPYAGFKSMASKIKPGGNFSVWVYGAENNAWITRVISPVRERFTSRLNPKALLHLSKLPAALVYAATKLFFGPLNKTKQGARFSRRLFYGEYLSSIAEFTWREQHTIVFDHLVAPTAAYISRPEFEEWWKRIGARDVVIGWHNRNSWRGFGQIV
jgi:SAM-dependent methyltransferase